MSEVLIRLQAYAMTVTGDGHRPMLLLKDESGEFTLPVPLSPLEAGVTLTQSNKMAPPTTPHRVAELLLKSMGTTIQRCVFKEIKHGHQWVELELSNHPLQHKTLSVRADESLSLCLHLDVPIFASREFINSARHYVADLRSQTPDLIINPKILERPHPYVM